MPPSPGGSASSRPTPISLQGAGVTVRSETPTTATEPPYPPAAPTETEVAGAGSAVERTDHRDHHPLPWDLPAEQWRLATAGGAFLLSFVVALTLMYGRRHPMFGEGSIGEYSALIAALSTAIKLLLGPVGLIILGVTALAAGEQPEPSFADGLTVQRVLAAVESSAAAGSTWVDVPG